MFELTTAAATRLARLLERDNVPDEITVRFILDGNKVTAGFDQVQPDDVRFEHAGRTILVLDDQLAQRLADRTLDVQDDGDGQQYIFRVREG